VPFKHHAGHCHHIPRPRYRVTNRPEYNAALRRRGNLTVWFTDEAIAAWRAEPRTTPGGQPHYSTLAITTALTMRTVFGLALASGVDYCAASRTGERRLWRRISTVSAIARCSEVGTASPVTIASRMGKGGAMLDRARTSDHVLPTHRARINSRWSARRGSGRGPRKHARTRRPVTGRERPV
jgi:hypothetical protein